MMEEKTLSEKYHFKGKIMNLRVDEIELPDGRKATREVCEHCDGVAVLPVKENGDVVLVRQFRYPFGKVLTEAPAGKVDAGEHHRDCAVRELSEETGYTSDKMEYLGFVYPSPGCFTERIHLYLAQELHEGESHPDDGELLDVLSLPFEEVQKMCEDGTISDAKTVLLVLRASKILQF